MPLVGKVHHGAGVPNVNDEEPILYEVIPFIIVHDRKADEVDEPNEPENFLQNLSFRKTFDF